MYIRTYIPTYLHTYHLDSQKRVIGTSAFRKECRGAGLKGSPPLSDFFKKQASAPTQPDDKSQPEPSACNTPADRHQGPTPRRLHFPTALREGTAAIQPVTSLHTRSTRKGAYLCRKPVESTLAVHLIRHCHRDRPTPSRLCAGPPRCSTARPRPSRAGGRHGK